MVWLAWDAANGLNTLTSKNAPCLSFPKNLTSTLGHTSVRSWDVKSRMQLCLIVENAPLWQLKECTCVVLN